LGVAFAYRDRKKKDDALIFSRGSLWRLNVKVNGLIEFTVLERYLGVTVATIKAPAEGRDFSVEWQPDFPTIFDQTYCQTSW
jgi:hypothetical protein